MGGVLHLTTTRNKCVQCSLLGFLDFDYSTMEILQFMGISH